MQHVVSWQEKPDMLILAPKHDPAGSDELTEARSS